MGIAIRCLKCKKRYKFEHSNTRIEGPVIHTKCPFCEEEVQRNVAKFAETQVGKVRNRFELISGMVAFARGLEKELR